MREADAAEVRRLPLFAGMAEERFAALIQAAFLQRFPPHVVLIEEGERADFLHVVLAGAVDLFARHEGRETTIMVLRPVRAFILAAVMADEPYLKSARTLEPSQILMIPAEAVRAVFAEDLTFAWAVVHELAGAYRVVTRELKNQKLRTSGERLANWILRMSGLSRERGGGSRFEIPFDKRTLAAYLGMTPENLSRGFAALADSGVTVQGRTVSVADVQALARRARPSPLIDDQPT
ncbi:helix-turn-helix domain-containing protein [Chelatococcus sp. SYSU_G07232]|uniref:Helix-turn-helix domain-containing protein n=1 Tax=Chelatococcus albus TaxID=3047466 RepID=A0ABT7AKM4_9HYPH|nr:cyclic nucleotide-binding domain-containing protein [Chelatococcus sp. SYSU_G07232]MDJ1159930.1 helix-turn-helix domain-containing protein [Chelatococcus sp. SYSU_G07232]